MHIIRHPESHNIEAFDGPTAIITPQLVESLLGPVRENKRRILEAGLDIEHLMQRVISHYFFSNDEINKARAKQFEALILTSDWCSFASKRRLIAHIVDEKGALQGKLKNDYDKALMDLMAARNAFTHGNISTDGRRVKLSYFQGSPRVLFLDDSYLLGVETTVNACWRNTMDIGFFTGAFKTYEMPIDPTPATQS